MELEPSLQPRKHGRHLCYLEALQIRDLIAWGGWSTRYIAYQYGTTTKAIRQITSRIHADHQQPDGCRPLTLLEAFDEAERQRAAITSPPSREEALLWSSELARARILLEHYGPALYGEGGRAPASGLHCANLISPEIAKLLNAALNLTFTHIWRLSHDAPCNYPR